MFAPLFSQLECDVQLGNVQLQPDQDVQVPARRPGGAHARPREDGRQDAEGDAHQRRGLPARGHLRPGQAHRGEAVRLRRHPGKSP